MIFLGGYGGFIFSCLFVSLAMNNYNFNVCFSRCFWAQRRAARPRKNQNSVIERGSPDMSAARQRSDRAFDDNNAHMGPLPLRDGGTLTAQDRDDIYRRTGVSCSVRYRPQWQERCLSLSGPSAWLSEARRLADERIAANGREGGRHPSPEETARNLTALRQDMERNNQWYTGQIGQLHHGLQQLTASHAQQCRDMQLQIQQLAAAVQAGVATANEARQAAERRPKSKKKRSKSRENYRDVAKTSRPRAKSFEPARAKSFEPEIEEEKKEIRSNAAAQQEEKEQKLKEEAMEDTAKTSSQTKRDNDEVKTEEKSELAKPVEGNSPTSPARPADDEVTGLHFHTCCSLFCNYVTF